MARGATLALKITGDASDAKRAFADADDGAGKFGKTMGIAAAGATALLGGIAMLGKAAFDSASNLQQQAGAVDAIFGANAKKMHGYAAQAASTVGLATSQYDELASVLGAQLGNAGLAGDQLTGTVNDLIGRGADLAAMFGGTTSDAVSALSSLLKGETDPIEKYGVSIKQSDINARLAAQGQSKLTGAALKTATAQAALALVTDQTAKANGAFARESDSAAGSGQILSAKWEDLKAKLGTGLLPLFAKAAGFLSDTVIPGFEKLTAAGGPLSETFAKIGAFITTQVVPALVSLWNEIGPKLIAAWTAIGEIVTGTVVPALMAIWKIIQDDVIPIIKAVLMPVLDGVVVFWGKLRDALEENKGKFQEIWDKIKPFVMFLKDTVAPFIGTVLKGAFDLLGKAIGPVVDVLTWILDKAASVIGFFGDVGEFLFGDSTITVKPGGGTAGAGLMGAGAGGVAPAGRLFGATSGGGGTGSASAGGGLEIGGTTVNVTINGALDPVAVGRQVNEALTTWARATGRQLAYAR